MRNGEYVYVFTDAYEIERQFIQNATALEEYDPTHFKFMATALFPRVNSMCLTRKRGHSGVRDGKCYCVGEIHRGYVSVLRFRNEKIGRLSKKRRRELSLVLPTEPIPWAVVGTLNTWKRRRIDIK